MASPPQGPHVAGLILARGGSAGIPLKNLHPLAGQPLLLWSLRALLAWDGWTSLWVSTDHPAIAACARAADPRVRVFERAPDFAHGQASSIAAVQEFLRARPEVDAVALVQCTSPLIQPQFLASAGALLRTGPWDAVFSVTRQKKFRWRETTDSTEPLNFDPHQRPRRQDWAGELVENGMFYLARRGLLESGRFQGGRCTYLEIPPAYSLEIDSPLDLRLAEATLSHLSGASDSDSRA